MQEGDGAVYVTGLLEGGSAAEDGRLRLGDKVRSSCVSVTPVDNGDCVLKNCCNVPDDAVSRRFLFATGTVWQTYVTGMLWSICSATPLA